MEATLKGLQNFIQVLVAYTFCNFSAMLKTEIRERKAKHMNPKGVQCIVTALDRLYSSDSDCTSSPARHLLKLVDNCHSDDSVSSRNGTRFGARTGNFDVDFPSTQHVKKNKGQGKTSKVHKQVEQPKGVQDSPLGNGTRSSLPLKVSNAPAMNEIESTDTDSTIQDIETSQPSDNNASTRNVTLCRQRRTKGKYINISTIFSCACTYT